MHNASEIQRIIIAALNHVGIEIDGKSPGKQQTAIRTSFEDIGLTSEADMRSAIRSYAETLKLLKPAFKFHQIHVQETVNAFEFMAWTSPRKPSIVTITFESGNLKKDKVNEIISTITGGAAAFPVEGLEINNIKVTITEK